MRFKKKERAAWIKKFAWLPVSFGDSFIWLEVYEDRRLGTDRYAGDTRWWETIECRSRGEVIKVELLKSL